MIVISQHGPDPLRSIQLGKSLGARLYEASIGGSVISSENKNIWPCLLGQTHHPTDFFNSDNAAMMHIGQLRNSKPFKPVRQIPYLDVPF